MEAMKVEHPIKYIQFALQFDVSLLQADLQHVLSQAWVPHFNSNGYEGQWNALSLYGNHGDPKDVTVPLEWSEQVSETPLLKECAYFQEVIRSFQFPLLAVRLMRLEAGAAIKPHRDHELGYEDGQFRLHIPIVTNDEVYFILDGERLLMQAGSCWYTNVNFTHEVANKGSEDRIHLVIDGVRNAWSDSLFFAHAPEEQFVRQQLPIDIATKRRMIEEMRMNPATANHPLIDQWENELKASARD
jgi:quercetin dioxygenase-like cupin family protein